MHLETLKQALIVRADYSRYIALYNNQTIHLQLSGRLHYQLIHKVDYPSVGDLVWFRDTDPNTGIIERLEQRKTVLRRLAQSDIHNAQIIAVNVDIAFLCLSCNEDFHIRKVENLLNMTYQEGIAQILLLTKTDLVDDPTVYVNEIQKLTTTDVYMVSIYDQSSIDTLESLIGTNTCVFIGSSGVGKSTLINALLHEEYFKTTDIRESDAQGRHTTTHREVILLPNGGTIIDTPGMRILDGYIDGDYQDYFQDIESFSQHCKFRDCTHTVEPGCNVINAIENGDLAYERLEQFYNAQRLYAHIQKKEAEKNRLLNKRQHTK